MSLIFSTGFDTAPSDADLRTQGWMGNVAAAPASGRAFASPINNTGIPGRSLRLAAYSGSAALPGTAQVGDPGFINTNKTINQLWQSGGFVVGARMKFNDFDTTGLASQNDGWTGGGDSMQTREVVTDGTNIYAVRKLTDAATTWTLQKSTDGGITWVSLPSPPVPNAVSAGSTLSSPEPGVLIVGQWGVLSDGPAYTTNDGQTWTQITGMGLKVYGACLKTGNANFPYAYSVGANNIGDGRGGIWLSTGTLNGPWAPATEVAASNVAVYPWGPMKFLPGLDSKLYAMFGNGWVAAVDLSVGSGGTMRQAVPALQGLIPYTLDYYNGALLVATNAGVYRSTTFAGTWSLISSAALLSSVVDKGVLTFVGRESSVYSTTDGLALTGRLYNGGPNVSEIGFHGMFAMGGKYVAWMSNGSLWHAESPSLRTQGGWQCIRWPDRVEQQPRAQTGFGIVGAVAGSIVPASGTFTVAASPQGANSSGLWLTAAQYSLGARVVSLLQPGLAARATASIPCSRLIDPTQLSNYHYYEIVAIADPAVVNAFFYALRIDGGYYVPRSGVSLALANTGDTTTLAIINLPRTGNWTQFDDLYMSDYQGPTNVGTIGPLNIMRRTMATDVMSEWTRMGTAPTDAQTVTKEGIETDLSNYMTSNVPGAREAFGTTASASPDLSGYTVRAIQIEAYVKKVSELDPNLVLAVGDVASDVIPLQVTSGPTFVSRTFASDSTGAAWEVSDVPNLVVSVRNSD